MLELGLSDLDFARPDGPWDALDVFFGSSNGVICKNYRERTDFVASNAFLHDFHVFSQWFFDRLSTQLLITSSIVFALDCRRSG